MRASSSIRYSPTSAACQLVPQAVRMIRLMPRSCCGVRFSPPNLALASSSFKPAAHRVFQRFGLLENLLEHVVRKAAQIDVGFLDRQVVHQMLDAAMVAMRDFQRIGGDHGDLMIGQIDDLVGPAGRAARRRWRRSARRGRRRRPAGCPAGRRRSGPDSRETESPGHTCRGASPGHVRPRRAASAYGSSAGNSSRRASIFARLRAIRCAMTSVSVEDANV